MDDWDHPRRGPPPLMSWNQAWDRVRLRWNPPRFHSLPDLDDGPLGTLEYGCARDRTHRIKFGPPWVRHHGGHYWCVALPSVLANRRHGRALFPAANRRGTSVPRQECHGVQASAVRFVPGHTLAREGTPRNRTRPTLSRSSMPAARRQTPRRCRRRATPTSRRGGGAQTPAPRDPPWRGARRRRTRCRAPPRPPLSAAGAAHVRRRRGARRGGGRPLRRGPPGALRMD